MCHPDAGLGPRQCAIALGAAPASPGAVLDQLAGLWVASDLPAIFGQILKEPPPSLIIQNM